LNSTNNTIRADANKTGVFTDISITPKNYESYYDIVDNFADKLLVYINALGGGVAYTKGTVLPAALTVPSSSSDRIMSVTLTNAGTALTALVLQAREIPGTFGANSFSDSYAILGGKKVTIAPDAVTYPNPLLDPANTNQSFTVTIDGSGHITILGYFPMQRSTCEHVYLRTSLVNNNLGSKSTHTGGNHGQDLSGTNILAKIPVQSEFVSYSSDSGTGYFVDLQLRNLSHIQFSITDHKNRRLPQAGRESGDNRKHEL